MRGSIRTRLLAAFLLVAIAAAVALSTYALVVVEAYGERRLQERLDTEARLSAALLEAAVGTLRSGRVGPQLAAAATVALRHASARTATRIMVVDAHGIVLADGGSPSAVGSSFASRPEIIVALHRGADGMATRTLSNGRLAVFVASPIHNGHVIVGATYTSSSTFSVVTLLRDYRGQLLLVALAFLVAAFVLTELLTRWLTAPLADLQEGARLLATDHTVRVRPKGPREIQELAGAFNQLAEEIERSSDELHDEELRKSRFISDVSHELRSPLTGIRLAAETLLEGDVEEHDEQRFLATIIREADRLTRLANDLLELQRIEGATGELPFKRVDLRKAALLAVEANEPVAADRGVVVTIEGESPEVLGAPDRLQQVIGNLVDNATRHTPAGKSVTVRLSGDDTHAVLEVLDEGPGIPPADLANLFERFWRAQYSRDRATGGTGLGLAIARAIVSAQGGTIEAANRPEGGAVFTVRLPALRD